MFFPRKRYEQLDPNRLLALRISLNAPVVAVDVIPTGPARAAIAVFGDASGELRLEVRLRSEGEGRVAAYACDEALGGEADIATSIDAALSFAESMGFLFDDELVGGGAAGGRVAVAEAWAPFAGESYADPTRGGRAAPARGEVPREAEPEIQLGAMEELLPEEPEPVDAGPDLASEADALDLVAGPDEGLDTPPAVAEATPEPPAEVAPAPLALSKFRGKEAADSTPADAAAAASKGKALGRVALVRKKRRPGSPERPNLLTRLLGAF